MNTLNSLSKNSGAKQSAVETESNPVSHSTGNHFLNPLLSKGALLRHRRSGSAPRPRIAPNPANSDVLPSVETSTSS
jgi:hypothetical protein